MITYENEIMKFLKKSKREKEKWEVDA